MYFRKPRVFQLGGLARQTVVSHCSTEAEVISSDAGLRLEGIPALSLLDLMRHSKEKTPQTSKGNGVEQFVEDPDFVLPLLLPPRLLLHLPNAHTSRQRASLFIFGDTDAVIKMVIKGWSPTMRHVAWTRRVDLDWLFDRINLDSGIQIKSVNTSKQIADILTKASFSRERWSQLTQLFYLVTPHVHSCSHFAFFRPCKATITCRSVWQNLSLEALQPNGRLCAISPRTPRKSNAKSAAVWF